MRRAIVILQRAFSDILDNPVVALQVSVLPLLLVTFVGQHFLDQAAQAQRGFLFVRGQFVWWLWALGVIGVVLPLLWMAVGWHRFVLLGEKPWLISPRLNIRPILAYGWASMVMTLLALLFTVVVGFAIGLVFGVGKWLIGLGDRQLLRSATEIIGAFLAAYAFMFLSGALVMAACGRRLSLRQAIAFGDRNTLTVFWLTIASLALAWGLEQITGLMHSNGLILGGYELISNWFLALFNVGLLTALVAAGGFALSEAPLPLAQQEPNVPQ